MKSNFYCQFYQQILMFENTYNLFVLGLLIVITSSQIRYPTPQYSVQQRQDEGYSGYFNSNALFGTYFDKFPPQSFTPLFPKKTGEKVNLENYMICAFSHWRSIWQTDDDIMLYGKYLSYSLEGQEDGVDMYRLFYHIRNKFYRSFVLSDWDFSRMLKVTPSNVKKWTFQIHTFPWSQVSSDHVLQHVNQLLLNRSKRTAGVPQKLTRCRGHDNKKRVYFENYEIEYQLAYPYELFVMATDWNKMLKRNLLVNVPGLPHFRYTNQFKNIMPSIRNYLIGIQSQNITDMIVGSTNLTCTFRINVMDFIHFKMPSKFTEFHIIDYQPNSWTLLSVSSEQAYAFDRRARQKAMVQWDKVMIVFGGSSKQSYSATYQTPRRRPDKIGNQHISLKGSEVEAEMKAFKTKKP